MKKSVIFSLFSVAFLLINMTSTFALDKADVLPQAGIAALFLTLTMGVFAIFTTLISLLFPILLILLSFATTAFWIWMLIDLLQRDDNDYPDKKMKDQKVMWLLIILLTGFVGAGIYYFMVYRVVDKK